VLMQMPLVQRGYIQHMTLLGSLGHAPLTGRWPLRPSHQLFVAQVPTIYEGKPQLILGCRRRGEQNLGTHAVRSAEISNSCGNMASQQEEDGNFELHCEVASSVTGRVQPVLLLLAGWSQDSLMRAGHGVGLGEVFVSYKVYSVLGRLRSPSPIYASDINEHNHLCMVSYGKRPGRCSTAVCGLASL
jgi:hypothetical protein